MSKHIVELTCGDPKSNQQTASKVECVINVNNHMPKPASNIKMNDETDAYISDEGAAGTAIDVDVIENADGKERGIHNCTCNSSAIGVKVKRRLHHEEHDIPNTTEGYVQTSTRPNITEAEIVNSNEVKEVLVNALTNILVSDDALLTSQHKNLHLQDERLVVLNLPDLRHLIGTIVRLVDPSFEDEIIKIRVVTNDVELGGAEVGCCGCAPSKHTMVVRPYNEIASISLGNQDLKIHQYEAYATIQEKLHVSLERVYSMIPDKKINDKKQVPMPE